MTDSVVAGFLHPGSQADCFRRSFQDLLFADLFGEQRIVSHKFGESALECGPTQIHTGRNELAGYLLESDAEWLFMVDADMGFASDSVEALVASADPVERPIVGGLAFAQKADGDASFGGRRYRCTPTLYRMYETDAEVGMVPMFDYPRDQLVEVDATGAAIVLIHRSVFEKIGDRPFHPIMLPKGPKGVTEFGEDMSFCLRAKAAGFPIYVNTAVKTTHDKGGVFYDEEFYDVQQWVLGEFRGL